MFLIPTLSLQPHSSSPSPATSYPSLLLSSPSVLAEVQRSDLRRAVLKTANGTAPSLYQVVTFFVLGTSLSCRVTDLRRLNGPPARRRSRPPHVVVTLCGFSRYVQSGLFRCSQHLYQLPGWTRELGLSLKPFRYLPDKRTVQHGWHYL